jgi:hypothetical protein
MWWTWVALGVAVACNSGGRGTAVVENRPAAAQPTADHASRDALVHATVAALSAYDTDRLRRLAPFADRMAADYDCPPADPYAAASAAYRKKRVEDRELALALASKIAQSSKLELIAIERVGIHEIPKGASTDPAGRVVCTARHDLVFEQTLVRVVVRTPGREPEPWPMRLDLVEAAGRWYIDAIDPVFGPPAGAAAVLRRLADRACACADRACADRAEEERAHLTRLFSDPPSHSDMPPWPRHPDALAHIEQSKGRMAACRAKLP